MRLPLRGQRWLIQTSLLTYPGVTTCRHLSRGQYASTQRESTACDSLPRMTISVTDNTDIAPWLDHISARLGRTPRGLRSVAAVNAEGAPAVIRVASVVDQKPFPTLYWLIDADYCLQIDRLEASGWIAKVQAVIEETEALQAMMAEDHRQHVALRSQFLHHDERDLLQEHGMESALEERGIGGIADLARVRCFHTWYAAHLVVPNCIGSIVDKLLVGEDDLSSIVGSILADAE
jgi:hypothetical protein